MTISINYRNPLRKSEILIDIDSIHQTENGIMFITALKACKVFRKSDIESITINV